MAQAQDDPFVDTPSMSQDMPFPMDSDDAFVATPIVANGGAPKTGDPVAKVDPTFMQDHISIQRSPSTAQSQVTVLSRRLSVKSNGSHDRSPKVAIASVLVEEADTRGRTRADSDSSITQAINHCTLKKSLSDRSNGSTRSAKSVRSVHAVGSYPIGTLRVHSPSPTRIPKEENHPCLQSGDVILVRDVPAGTCFGYDTISFVVQPGHVFDGIKDIPAGPHLVWGGSAGSSLRDGFWIMSKKRASDQLGSIHLKRWNKFDEVLEEEISVAETLIQKQCLPEIFDKLESYTVANPNTANKKTQGIPGTSVLYAPDSNIWHHLTSCIKFPLLDKVTGKSWNKWHVSSAHDAKPAIEHLSSKIDGPADFGKSEVLNFVFPKDTRTFSQNSVGRERTEQAMDTSSHVRAIISNCSAEDADEIIGETQFCYVTGMILGNAACMEHWAHIIRTIFRAFRLAVVEPVFFRKVIEAVHAQFIYDDSLTASIFDHDSSLESDLKLLLTTFKSRLNEQLLAQGSYLSNDQSAVGRAFEEFESWLWKWDWDLRGNYVRAGKIQLEDGEYVDAEMKDFEAEDERGKL